MKDVKLKRQLIECFFEDLEKELDNVEDISMSRYPQEVLFLWIQWIKGHINESLDYDMIEEIYNSIRPYLPSTTRLSLSLIDFED